MSRPALLAAAAVALLLMPFAGKAYHVDDTLFLDAARQIRKTPLAPYAFEVNWGGTPGPMWAVTQNPPLNAYLLAAVQAVAGEGEVAAHVVYAALAAACVALFVLVARRFTAHPLLAAALAAASPAFFVSATSVMGDVPLLLAWLAGVLFLLRAAERGRPALLWWAGLAATAAAMTKYFGLALAPLLAAAWWLRTRRFTIHLAALALPVLAVLLWGAYSVEQWGSFHPLGTVGHAALYSEVRRTAAADTIVFLAGALFWPVLLAPAAARLSRTLLAAAILLAAALAALALGPVPAGTRALWIVLLVAGSGLALLLVEAWRARPDADGHLVALWAFGTLAFSAFVNWSVAARVILPAALPASILFARWIESRPSPGRWVRAAWLAVPPTAALSLLLAAADARHAGASRAFAERATRDARAAGVRLLFSGHWGFQHYMERGGAIAYDYNRALEEQAAPGDRIAVSVNNTCTYAIEGPLEGLAEERAASRLPLQVLSFLSHAGFYSSVLGRVPFAPSQGKPLDRFLLFRYAGEEKAQATRDPRAG